VILPERFWTSALHVWINVGVILCLVLWLHGGLFIPSGDASRDAAVQPRADFMMFYGGALLVKTSPSELYDVEKQGAAQKAATGLNMAAGEPDFLPYPYPAIVALLFVPFTVVPYKTAYAVMMMINFVLLGTSIWLLSARLNLNRPATETLVLCTTACISVYATFLQGQVSFVALLLFVFVVTNLRTGNEGRAGLWAGFLAFKPTLIPFWLFWFAVRRRWRALAGAIASSSMLAAVSVLVSGIDGTRGYLRISQGMARGDWILVLPNDMPTLKAFLHFFGLPDAVWVVSVAILLLIVWRSRPSQDREYCVVIIGTILGTPHMHPQELVLLLIVVALMLAEKEKISSRVTWAFVAFILWQAIVRFLFGGSTGNHWPVMPITLVVLLAYLVRRPSREEHASAGAIA
jgi:hypothetical protein